MIYLICIVPWFLSWVFLKNKNFLCAPWKKVFLFCFVHFLIAIIVLNVFFVAFNLYLDVRLHSFDLNGDGVFSENEQTSGQIAFFDFVINDTGRNIARYFFSPISYVVFYCVSL